MPAITSTEPLDELFEIDDPEIDLDGIMQQIRERIRERREALGYDSSSLPTFGAAVFPGEPEDIPYDPILYNHLRLANDLYASAPTATQLAPSPATRLPLIGRLWQLVRGQMHALVLFYVNRHVAHQVNVDRHVISVLNRLALLAAQQQREIAALRTEVEALLHEKDT